MLRFNLGRIPVGIHWMFWLLVAFLGGAFRASGREQWIGVLLFMAAALISILVHELGHALAGLKQGARQAYIELHGLGGTTRFDRSADFSRKQRILMTAAGPAASIALAGLVLGIIALGIFPRSTDADAAHPFSYFLVIMVFINLFWSAVNLFPIIPLDGGQIVRDLLGPQRLKLTCIISFATLGILALLLWTFTGSIYNMIIMALLGLATWNAYQSAR